MRNTRIPKNTSKQAFADEIVGLLGGRAAEKLIFNQLTTGAGNDIERATELARKMVCEWGMSDKLGPLAYGAKEEELFLGREITRSKNFSENTQIEIDAEVRRIVTDSMKRAEKILKQNLSTLHRISNALLEREILDADEINKLIRGEELPPLDKQKNGQPTEKPKEQPGLAAKPPKSEVTPSSTALPPAKAKKNV